ncbi:MAG: hypothetical protein GX158_00555 [Bacteroidales bacterium]|nr:hypothetical protein [Bacteroidales bacterium]
MKEHRLKKLLEKYYSANISTGEEQELKDLLCGDSVFPGYEIEREIFRYYSESEKIPVPSSDFETRIIKAIDDLEESVQKQKLFPKQIPVSEQKSVKRYLLTLSGAAATILIIITFWFFFKLDKEPDDTYTDPSRAYAETMKVLSDVSLRLNMAAEAVIPVADLAKTTFDDIKALSRSLNSFNTGLTRTGLQIPDNNHKDENALYSKYKKR